jgi:hypothetical protein
MLLAIASSLAAIEASPIYFGLRDIASRLISSTTFLTGNIMVPHGSTFNSMEHNKEAPELRRQLAEDTMKADTTLQETIAVEGYVADTLDERFVNVKTAKDGHTILIPQPSDDPNDPLNWSSARKHVILFIMSIAAFLPDYGSATGAVTLIPQAQ